VNIWFFSLTPPPPTDIRYFVSYSYRTRAKYMDSISYVDNTHRMTTVFQLSSNRFMKFILLLIFHLRLWFVLQIFILGNVFEWCIACRYHNIVSSYNLVSCTKVLSLRDHQSMNVYTKAWLISSTLCTPWY